MWVRIGFVFMVLWPGVLTAQVSCDTGEGLICIEAQQTDSGVTLYGLNRFPMMPVTLTLDVTVENLQRRKGGDGPYVLQPGARRMLMSLKTKRRAAWRYDYRFEWSRGDITARHDIDHVYQLPFARGQSFAVIQSCNGSFSHKGGQRYALDFDLPKDTPVHAARAGKVVGIQADSRRGGPTAAYRNDGNYIYIQHSDGTLGNYVHFRPQGVVVVLGEMVQAGDLIGYSGNTGWSTGPHLHFSVDIGGRGLESVSVPITFATARGLESCPQRGRKLRAP